MRVDKEDEDGVLESWQDFLNNSSEHSNSLVGAKLGPVNVGTYIDNESLTTF